MQITTKTLKSFYSNQVVSIWNRLLNDLRQFKSNHWLPLYVNWIALLFKVSKHFFNCDNVCSWTSTCGCQDCAWYLDYHNQHVFTQYHQHSICDSTATYTAELMGESLSLCFLRMTEASHFSLQARATSPPQNSISLIKKCFTLNCAYNYLQSLYVVIRKM